MFKYLMAIWNFSWRFGIFCDRFVHFVFIWNICSGFGIMYKEKSGNIGPMGESLLWAALGKVPK
jgi:hypothetical protein